MSNDILNLLTDDDKIELSDNVTVCEYEFSASDFLLKTTAWYGGTMTGKTRHVKTILSKIKDSFPRIILFSPTNIMSGDFKDIIPDALCISEFTPEAFQRVYQQCTENANNYRTANDVKNLQDIFNIVANQQQKTEYSAINTRKKSKLSEIESAEPKLEIRREKIQQFCNSFDPLLIRYMKAAIAPHRNKLFAQLATKKQNNEPISISDNAFTALKCLDLDPNILIIFDDCQNEISDLMRNGKKNSIPLTSFKNMFTRGRHDFITSWLILHDDVLLKPYQRKSIKNNIISSKPMAISFFQRTGSAMNVDNDTRKVALKITESLFTGVSDDRKLFFRTDRQGDEQFTYTKPEVVGIFTTSSPSVANYCDKIKET